MAVSELKHSKNLWSRLESSREVVLTRDGKPGALMVSVSSENLEEIVVAVRRALFSQAVSKARTRAEADPVSDADIEREIRAARS
ncbi:hypothetical protein [Puniceicoccus vermicola]